MTSSMAEVSYLRLAETMEDPEQEDIFAFEPVFPFDDDHIHHAGAFDPEICDWIGAYESASSDQVLESENQVTFVMDLLQHCVEESHVLEIGSFEPVPILEYDFRMIDRNVEEIGGNSYELDAGEGELLGLGSVFDGNKRLGICSGDDEDDNLGGFSVCDSNGSSSNRFSGGSNLVDLGWDSEENGDMNIALCWDSVQLEDEELEWEEVDGAMEALIPERGDQVGSRNLEWEVLLNVNNTEGPYMYTAEYEMSIAIGVENHSVSRPPASKSAVESLPSIIVTDEDNALCVVCKDDIGVGEEAKHLPCYHCYHAQCIISWLQISNTCPVCRYELPTDDPHYERGR